jgi:hypothetical protein
MTIAGIIFHTLQVAIFGVKTFRAKATGYYEDNALLTSIAIIMFFSDILCISAIFGF